MTHRIELNWSALYPNLFEKYVPHSLKIPINKIKQFDPDNIPEADIRILIFCTKCTRKQAIDALKSCKGNMSNAMMTLPIIHKYDSLSQ